MTTPVNDPGRAREPDKHGTARFAPSPTGDLHVGNLRTALLGWLFARTSGRAFLLRVEDLDPGRVRAGMAARQRADLESLGIEFDPPLLLQSQRAAAYEAALEVLAEHTFECFCTRREIAEAASAPHAAPGRYPGTCRELTAAERAERRSDRPPALRLRADGATQSVHDLLHGEVSATVDDIVLRRNDRVAAYHLAVVVDDVASGVDQIVRGDDLLSAAPSQAYLARLLGAPVPTYAHVPLAVNSSGQRLAKRDGAVTLPDLAARGVTAAQVLSILAASLGLAEPGEPVTAAGLVPRFSAAALPRQPWVPTGV